MKTFFLSPKANMHDGWDQQRFCFEALSPTLRMLLKEYYWCSKRAESLWYELRWSHHEWCFCLHHTYMYECIYTLCQCVLNISQYLHKRVIRKGICNLQQSLSYVVDVQNMPLELTTEDRNPLSLQQINAWGAVAPGSPFLVMAWSMNGLVGPL